MTNDEIQKRVTFKPRDNSDFGFRISLVIRHSDLVILMSTLALCAVNPSFPAKRRMSSATNSSAARSYEMTDERRRPGNEDGRSRAMLGLRDEIAGEKIGPRRLVGQNDDLAGTGHAVDVDLSEDVLLGERDEQIPRADDFIDALDSLDAVRE